MEEKTPEETDAPHAPPPDALIRALPEAVTTTDLTGRITYASSRTLEMHGYEKPEELLGTDSMLLLVPEHREVAAERLREILAEGALGVLEYEMLRRDGSRFPAELTASVVRDANGQPRCLIAITRDIGERKRAEAALRREHDLVSRIAETSPIGISVLDRQGQIVFANAYLQQVLGISSEEITSRSYNAPQWRITDYQGDPYPDEHLPFQRVRRTGEAVSNVCHAIEWPDGRRRLLSVNAAPLFDESGRFDGMVAATVDVTGRRQSEAALRDSLQSSADIVQAIPSGLFIYQFEAPDRLVLLDGNPEGERLTGLNIRESVGKEFNELWPTARADGILDFFLSPMRTGRPAETEDMQYKDDRLEGAFRIRAFPMPGRRLGVAFENVTERKRAEEALRGSEERFRSVIEAAASVIICLSPDGRVLTFNPEAERLYDCKAADALGRDYFETFLPQEARDAVARDGDKVLAGEPTIGFENAVIARDGTRRVLLWNVNRFLDAQGEPAGFVAVGQDITERTASEQALRESEEKFRKVFQTSPNSIVISTMDGCFVDVNEGFVTMTGYRREEIVGKSTIEIDLWVQPDGRRRLIEALRRDGSVENLETEFRMKDGSIRTALISSNVIDLGGTPHILSVTRDITELRGLLEQARLDGEIKQNLLRELNHRVKNNLATITSLMYLERSHPTQTKDEFISACLTRITSLAELHSILGEQVDRAIEAEPLIRRVTGATVSGALPPLPTVEFALNADGLRLGTDIAGGLAMALSELVANALRHAVPKTENPDLHVCLQEVDGLWRLTVSDNGPGLPEGFDPSRDGGTGLKLVRQIARKQLRGDVFFERRDGRTAAVICFPQPPLPD